jgi:hypothetical protein
MSMDGYLSKVLIPKQDGERQKLAACAKTAQHFPGSFQVKTLSKRGVGIKERGIWGREKRLRRSLDVSEVRLGTVVFT